MKLNHVIIAHKVGVGNGRSRGASAAARRRLDYLSRCHDASVDAASAALDNMGIRHDVFDRSKLRRKTGVDLIISIGGDGTFLAAAHRAGDIPVLGFNSMPGHSVGFYCAANVKNIEQMLIDIELGDFRAKELPLIEARIGLKSMPALAINDLLFAGTSPSDMVRYTIRVDGVAEKQRSSGVWIAAGPGSTAAIRSAGGKTQGITSQRLQYVLREPYVSAKHKYRKKQGILKLGSKVSLVSEVSGTHIYVDGNCACYPVKCGETFTAKASKKKLKAFL
jgi:NAD+ kinase